MFVEVSKVIKKPPEERGFFVSEKGEKEVQTQILSN